MLEGCVPYPAAFRDRYVGEGYWRRETIAQAAEAAAAAWPQAPAIVDSRGTLTYAGLIEESRRYAAALVENGINAGDRIVIQIPNRSEFAILALACFRLGVVPVMALPALRRAELEYIVGLARARALAIAPEHRGFDHAGLARELALSCPSLMCVFSVSAAPGCIDLGASRAGFSSAGAAGPDPFDVALFLLSGGTTGLPKLIPRTHTDYLYNAREAAKVCALERGDRILLALPIEHNFPLACPGLVGALLCGATAVLAETTRAAELAATIAREKVTHLPCVPTLAINLLELSESERRQLRSLRVITVGGQRLQEPTARALKGAFPALTVQQVFGMAEGLLCYTRLDDPNDVACTTQGRPMSPLDEIRIVDSEGNDVVDGEVGELWCRGPYTIRGYFRAADRNAEAFTADGFYRTGDLVRRAPSGNLVVEGRLKDLINRGGEKISAEEVESHLMAHPAVSAAAVVAMRDPTLGERACAYVTLKARANITLDEVRRFLESRGLARFKWPERLEVVDAMPLTNVGKIRKTDLRRDIEARLAAERRAADAPASPHSEQGRP
jgi:2,3-dihydroxybenzoate-AMP ligase